MDTDNVQVYKSDQATNSEPVQNQLKGSIYEGV